jgi:mevalonate pyrophosphate decarboxylase
MEEILVVSSPMTTATALAYPNLAFIKYWGNRHNAYL